MLQCHPFLTRVTEMEGLLCSDVKLCKVCGQRNPHAAGAHESLKSSKSSTLLGDFSVIGFILIAHISKKLKGVSHIQNLENLNYCREVKKRNCQEREKPMTSLFHVAFSGDNGSIPGCTVEDSMGQFKFQFITKSEQ